MAKDKQYYVRIFIDEIVVVPAASCKAEAEEIAEQVWHCTMHIYPAFKAIKLFHTTDADRDTVNVNPHWMYK
jgi:hypothetical protein